MIQDPISDMLTRIRNALMVKKRELYIPFSNMKWALAKLLKEGRYIESFEKVNGTPSDKDAPKSSQFDQILIVLKYENSQPAITSLKRMSRPGRRLYVKKGELPIVLNNLGIAIISTPQGLMTNKTARKLGLGGEVVCEIY